MSNDLHGWNDVRRISDEIGLQLHLAGMDARDRWHALQPRLEQLEKTISHSGEHAAEAVNQEISELRAELLRLRNEVFDRAKGDYLTGW